MDFQTTLIRRKREEGRTAEQDGVSHLAVAPNEFQLSRFGSASNPRRSPCARRLALGEGVGGKLARPTRVRQTSISSPSTLVSSASPATSPVCPHESSSSSADARAGKGEKPPLLGRRERWSLRWLRRTCMLSTDPTGPRSMLATSDCNSDVLAPGPEREGGRSTTWPTRVTISPTCSRPHRAAGDPGRSPVM